MERRDVREFDEAAGMILFGLVHAVVDQAADSNVWLIEARAAGEHRNVDACLVHHSHMCRKIGEQRIEPVISIAFSSSRRVPSPLPRSINSGGV